MISLVALIATYRDYPEILARGVQREWHMLQGNQASARDDYKAAEQAYRAALQVDTGFVDTEIALALALGTQGQQEQAIAALSPQASRRSVLVEGVFSRTLANEDNARALLRTIERRTGEDSQRWALQHVPVEPRNTLVLGDDALDLGYIAGFAEAEVVGERNYRWLSGQGTVVMPLPDPLQAGDTIEIELAAPLVLDGPLVLNINDGAQVAIRPDLAWRTYRLVVPPMLSGQQELRLRLRAPTHLPMNDNPESNDPRALSVMVHRVAVR
jgi:hypothetical protein